MYAAAGGASCRNARRRQQQQAVKDKLDKANALKEKLAAAKAQLASKQPKSKQFHQLPANYLRTPYGGARKLSAGYTGHSSKLLLPINEQSANQHSPSQQFLSSSHYHQHNHSNQHPRTPTLGHHRGDLRLDVNHHHQHHKTLTKSATASFPLALHAHSPPTSPPINGNNNNNFCPFHHPKQFKASQSNLLSVQVPVANENGIIITPATPLVSPSPSGGDKQQQQHQQQSHNQQMGSLHDLRKSGVDDLPEFPLERACSVYRNRKLEAEEDATTTKVNITNEQQQFYMPNGYNTQQWTNEDEFCDAENRECVCTCDRVEVNFLRVLFYYFLINHLHVLLFIMCKRE
jgi:hypothetical protein